MADIQTLLARIGRAVDRFAERGPEELEAQGHVATRNLIFSFETRIDSQNLDRIRAMIMTLDYGIDVDTGTTALEVRQKGRKHLLEILDWIAVINPNMPPPERRRFAEATTRKHQQVGVPTPASKRFSQNGRRTGWIQAAYGETDAQRQLEEDLQLIEGITELFEDGIAEVNRA